MAPMIMETIRKGDFVSKIERDLYDEGIKAQKRDYDAGFVGKRFQASWKGGSTQLKVANLL